MEENSVKKPQTGRWLKLLIKLAVTIACIWYISGKIDFTKAGATLKTANWFYLLPALLAFIFSKLISALRLNIYFRNVKLRLSDWKNIKLYWLGMFYNLFLPGSIGGDAYKVLLLKKKYNVSYKKLTAAVLLDRFSGLLGLGLILAVYSIIVIDNTLYIVGIGCAAVLGVLILYFVVNRWLKDYVASFFPTLLLGLLVQGTQVICAYFIMASLGIPVHVSEYVFIFLVSSIVSVLPLTIGGLGIREVVFLEGSKQLGLMQETSVVISLLFYLITLLTSAIGLLYVFRNPLEEKVRTHY